MTHDAAGGGVEHSAMPDTGANAGPVAELRTAAQGWQRIQLAVLGFVGLCGVLQGDGGAGLPRWLQVLSGLLVLMALVLACAAIVVVATVAWPFERSTGHAMSQARVDERSRRRLRLGIVGTFVAVAVTALATAAAWWPRDTAAPAAIEVATRGGVACGELRDGGRGVLALDIDGRVVRVPLGDVFELRVVDRCP